MPCGSKFGLAISAWRKPCHLAVCTGVRHETVVPFLSPVLRQRAPTLAASNEFPAPSLSPSEPLTGLGRGARRRFRGRLGAGRFCRHCGAIGFFPFVARMAKRQA